METIPAVVRTVEVGADPERAFAVFTDRMGEWWPLAEYSMREEHAVGVRFEGRVGGKVVELVDDGSECEWADVLVWDPPHRLVLAWHPTENPTASTELEVRFTPSAGGTRVELEHRGWERLGDRATEARSGYEQGWPGVLELYVRLLASG